MNNIEPAGSNAIAARQVAEQAEVELKILLGIEQSLRVALQWMTRERGNSHKLSTLRFAARSFERHLARTRVLADHSGYMQSISDENPHLASEVRTLRDRRDELQDNFERVILRLEYVSPDDADALERVCGEIECYLDQLKTHGQKEMELLQQSFAQVEGGEA